MSSVKWNITSFHKIVAFKIVNYWMSYRKALYPITNFIIFVKGCVSLNRTYKDARVKRTLQSLSNALICLMKEHVIQNITIKHLCEEANVTRQTFYSHFHDLDNFVDYISQVILKDFRSKVHTAVAKKPKDLLSLKNHQSFISIFEHIMDNQAFYESFLVKNPTSPFAEGLKREIKDFIRDGLNMVASDDTSLILPREVVIQYTTAGIFEVIIWWIRNNYPYSIEEMAQMLLQQSIKGPYSNEF